MTRLQLLLQEILPSFNKRKDGVSTRVDETTIRIYFPWVPEADLTFQDKTVNAQGPRLLLITHSPS